MRKVVRFVARVPKDGGGYDFQTISTKSKPKPPQNALSFYLRYSSDGKRHMQAVGNDFEVAYLAFVNRETMQEYEKRGLAAPEFTKDKGGFTLREAADQFIRNQTTLDKATSTVYGYTRAVEQFRDSCRRTCLADVTRQDMLDHIEWIRANVPTRSHGQQNGTIRTRLQFLTYFFTENGMKNPLPQKQWPKVEERKVEAYTPEQLNKLLSKATPDEKDLIFFFLYTGFRDDEAAHTVYGDVNFTKHEIKVGPKPEINYTTKNGKERVVRVPADLVERLQERRERNPEGILIFPNKDGNVDSCLLARVRCAAERAGITERITLHKFRKTFGTRYGEKHGIVNAQHLLGHASIRTTQKYMAQTKIAAAAVEELFSDVAGK